MTDISNTYIKSPLGNIKASFKGDVLVELIIINKIPSMREASLNKTSTIGEQLQKELNEYLVGKRKKFDIKIEFEGTDFQHQVWDELVKIPYGISISYKDIADKIKRPKSYRAVGNAVGANPIAIIVPCHRVLGTNGMGGYAYGLGIKKQLLELENVKM